jgi:acyl-coenzyme A synthetase/AMP-(fatty) acid ligase
MILDAKVPPEDLKSIRYFFGGGAPMSPELQSELESTYGVKVIWAYGATEFCGTIVSWTPDLHERYGVEKRGAMGRALPGVQLRVVDVESGEPLTSNKVGYLSALVPTVKDDWITTTDLALIDADGFVFHQGRGDGAIIRGGFKVLPEKIVEALLTHPAVLDAAVIALPDQRLGQLPVAAVELKAGVARPSEEELREHAKRELIVYAVPARILIVDTLPRTASLKVNLNALKAFF